MFEPSIYINTFDAIDARWWFVLPLVLGLLIFTSNSEFFLLADFIVWVIVKVISFGFIKDENIRKSIIFKTATILARMLLLVFSSIVVAVLIGGAIFLLRGMSDWMFVYALYFLVLYTLLFMSERIIENFPRIGERISFFYQRLIPKTPQYLKIMAFLFVSLMPVIFSSVSGLINELKNVLLENESWSAAKSSNNPDAITHYLENYPNGRHPKEAYSLYMSLANEKSTSIAIPLLKRFARNWGYEGFEADNFISFHADNTLLGCEDDISKRCQNQKITEILIFFRMPHAMEVMYEDIRNKKALYETLKDQSEEYNKTEHRVLDLMQANPPSLSLMSSPSEYDQLGGIHGLYDNSFEPHRDWDAKNCYPDPRYTSKFVEDNCYFWAQWQPETVLWDTGAAYICAKAKKKRELKSRLDFDLFGNLVMTEGTKGNNDEIIHSILVITYNNLSFYKLEGDCNSNSDIKTHMPSASNDNLLFTIHLTDNNDGKIIFFRPINESRKIILRPDYSYPQKSLE